MCVTRIRECSPDPRILAAETSAALLFNSDAVDFSLGFTYRSLNVEVLCRLAGCFNCCAEDVFAVKPSGIPDFCLCDFDSPTLGLRSDV